MRRRAPACSHWDIITPTCLPVSAMGPTLPSAAQAVHSPGQSWVEHHGSCDSLALHVLLSSREDDGHLVAAPGSRASEYSLEGIIMPFWAGGWLPRHWDINMVPPVKVAPCLPDLGESESRAC